MPARCIAPSAGSSPARTRRAITQGVRTDGGGTLRLAVFDLTEKTSAALNRFRHIFPDTERVDHRILAGVLLIEETQALPTVLVTKDLNMHLKALAVGLRCEDYLNDKVEARDVRELRPALCGGASARASALRELRGTGYPRYAAGGRGAERIRAAARRRGENDAGAAFLPVGG